MAKKQDITKEQIEERLIYVPERGVFLRRFGFRQWKVGEEVGSGKHSGWYVPVGNYEYARKHLVWVMERRAYPDAFLLNVNGDIYDDRIENLLRIPTNEEITREIALALFTYDQEAGVLTRKVNCQTRNKGSKGNLMNNGYYSFTVGSILYLSHRLIWLMVHGWWPENIDHINGVRTDNRLENLRAVTRRENSRNTVRCRNSTGVTGVYINERGLPYRARIGNDKGKMENLGNFATLEEAAEARRKAEERLGYHPNHGKTKKERAES